MRSDVILPGELFKCFPMIVFPEVVHLSGMNSEKIMEENAVTETNKTRVRSALNHTKFNILWIILCLAVNCHQIYHLSSQYFSYAINTNVQLFVDENFEAPTMTLCFDLVHVIKWHELTPEERRKIFVRNDSQQPVIPNYVIEETEESVKNLPGLIKEVTDYVYRIMLTSNVQELNMSRVFEVTYNVSEIFEFVLLYLEDYPLRYIKKSYYGFSPEKEKNLSLKEIYSVTEFIKDMFRCYSLQRRDKYKNIKYYHVMRQPVMHGIESINRLKLDRVKNLGEIHYIPMKNGMPLRSVLFVLFLCKSLF